MDKNSAPQNIEFRTESPRIPITTINDGKFASSTEVSMPVPASNRNMLQLKFLPTVKDITAPIHRNAFNFGKLGSVTLDVLEEQIRRLPSAPRGEPRTGKTQQKSYSYYRTPIVTVLLGRPR